jgi:endonuclease-3
LKIPSDAEKIWLEKIKEFIKSISFFNNKSNNILKTSQILSQNHNSIPPDNIEDLIKLPWVWIKTAKVYLAVMYDAPHIWVDTHVHRVLNRVWLVKTKTPLETDKKISNYFTKQNHSMLHNTLVLFWRYNCTARKPKCSECPFLEKCNYKK